jgi:hypothetical protein
MATTNYSNLPPIQSTNDTTEFFNNFFKQPTPGVSSNVNDAVIGYFQSITGDREAGVALASAVLLTAAQQGLSPMEIVDQFNSVADPGELTAYLTMFLNLNRQGTSLLGLSNQPQTNKYVTRAILP